MGDEWSIGGAIMIDFLRNLWSQEEGQDIANTL
jgi:hypothetical protein